jgi:hypothetical protein
LLWVVWVGMLVDTLIAKVTAKPHSFCSVGWSVFSHFKRFIEQVDYVL